MNVILRWLNNLNQYFNTINKIKVTNEEVVLGGLGVTCSPRDPRFVGSNPAEVDGFFSGRKYPDHFKLGVPSLIFQAR